MTETTEQRIERVARAICIADDGDPDQLNGAVGVKWRLYEAEAVAADAISFAAGWDAATETLRERAIERKRTGADMWHEDYREMLACVAYLAAHRPGDET